MSTPEAKRQKMDTNGVSNGNRHGYGFDVGVNYEESSVSTFYNFNLIVSSSYKLNSLE